MTREALRDWLADWFQRHVPFGGFQGEGVHTLASDLLAHLGERREQRHYVCEAHMPTGAPADEACPCCIAVQLDAQLRARGGLGADRLADEVAVLIRRGIIDARSPAGDALLDYREPPSTPRADRLAELESQAAAHAEDLRVAREIGASFFEALKPLNLPAINVANPGQHVTDLIAAHAEEIERLRAIIADLRETRPV